MFALITHRQRCVAIFRVCAESSRGPQQRRLFDECVRPFCSERISLLQQQWQGRVRLARSAHVT